MSARSQLSITSILVVLIALMLASNTGTRVVSAAETATVGDDAALPTEPAVVSDLTVEQLAREILTLQQQMGGSVVQTFEPNPWPDTGNRTSQALITDQPANSNWPLHPTTNVVSAVGHHRKIEELREVAFSLDTTAHRLEKLDLYEQADALRQVANRLRSDARQLQQTSAAPNFPLPAPTDRSRGAASRK